MLHLAPTKRYAVIARSDATVPRSRDWAAPGQIDSPSAPSAEEDEQRKKEDEKHTALLHLTNNLESELKALSVGA